MKFEDVVKAQRELAARVKERIETVTKAASQSPQRVLRDLERRRAELETELRSAIASRDEAVRRHDDQIARTREALTAAERDLAEAKATLEGEEKDKESKEKEKDKPAAAPKGKGKGEKG
jgi:flagellar biosynthesis regulator FlaF